MGRQRTEAPSTPLSMCLIAESSNPTTPDQAHRVASASTMVLTTFQKSGLNTMVSTAATKLGSVGSTYPSSQVITQRSACKDRDAISRRLSSNTQDAKTSGKTEEALGHPSPDRVTALESHKREDKRLKPVSRVNCQKVLD